MTNGNQPTTNTGPNLTDLQNQLAIIQAQSALQLAPLQAQLAVQQAQSQLAHGPITAQLELLQKLFPQGQAAAPAATITTSGETWSHAPGISLAYEVIDELAAQLIDQLQADLAKTLNENDVENAKVLIVDTLQYAQDDIPRAEVVESIKSFEANLQRQRNNVTTVRNSIDSTPEAFPADAGPPSEVLPAVAAPLLLGVAAAPSIISTFAGVAGYFQSTYSVTGQKFDVPTEGLVAAVAGKLSDIVKVRIQNFYAIGESALLDRFMGLQRMALDLKTETDNLAIQIAKPLNDQITTLNQRIRDLDSQRMTLDSATKQPEIEKIQRDIAELKTTLKPIQDSADLANATAQTSNSILSEFTKFATAITTSADGQPTKLAQAVLRDKVYQAGITHILHLKIIFSGGQAITEQKLGPDKIGYSGETGLSFHLVTKDGDTVSSGLLNGKRTETRKL